MASYDLSASGVQTLNPSGALSVAVTTLPQRVSLGRGNPGTRYDVGLLRLGNADGYFPPIPIVDGPQLIAVPNAIDRMGYVLFDGAAVHIVEITAYSPWQGPQGPPGVAGSVGPAGPAGATGSATPPITTWGRYDWTFGPLTTPPLASAFTWVNQGGASAVDLTGGGLFLRAPAVSGSNVRALVQAAPATPYTLTVAVLVAVTNLNNIGGLIFRESGTGKLTTIAAGISGNMTTWTLNKYTSPTAWNSNYIAAYTWPTVPVWIRMYDDGTNRVSSMSADGVNFTQIHTVGHTDFLTPNQVGIFAETNNTTAEGGVTLLSWAVT